MKKHNSQKTPANVQFHKWSKNYKLKELPETTAHSHLQRSKCAHDLAEHTAPKCTLPARFPSQTASACAGHGCDTCPDVYVGSGPGFLPVRKGQAEGKPPLPPRRLRAPSLASASPPGPRQCSVLRPPLPWPQPGGARTLEGSVITCTPAPDAHALASGPGCSPHPAVQA